jgi:hypothetical protein
LTPIALTAPSSSSSPARLDHRYNFATFGKAMISLWRCATGDGWEDLFFATRVRHSKIAPMYFLSFMVFCSMVMVNLFIAVILVRHPPSSGVIASCGS